MDKTTKIDYKKFIEYNKFILNSINIKSVPRLSTYEAFDLMHKYDGHG